jgi:hypothetical protein
VYCAACGTENPPDVNICQSCGKFIEAKSAPPASRPPGPVSIDVSLVGPILATLFCCQPFGIVAIVFAAMAMSHASAGNLEAAERSAAQSRQWTNWAVAGGLAALVVYIVLAAVAVALD